MRSLDLVLLFINSPEAMDEIVPRISTFANTQNKIQVADFSANDPFHRKLEELSRTIWAPAQNGSKPCNWFYERARGQYADMLTRETTTKYRIWCILHTPVCHISSVYSIKTSLWYAVVCYDSINPHDHTVLLQT